MPGHIRHNRGMIELKDLVSYVIVTKLDAKTTPLHGLTAVKFHTFTNICDIYIYIIVQHAQTWNVVCNMLLGS